MGRKTMKLSQKQERFLKEYEIDGNARRAALAAGYKPRSGGDLGDRLLKSPNISRELERRRIDRNKKHEITLDRILQGLLKEAELPKEQGGTPSVRVAAWRAIADIGGFTAPQRLEIDASPLAARLNAARKRVAIAQEPQPAQITSNTKDDDPVLQTAHTKDDDNLLSKEKNNGRRICFPTDGANSAGSKLNIPTDGAKSRKFGNNSPPAKYECILPDAVDPLPARESDDEPEISRAAAAAFLRRVI